MMPSPKLAVVTLAGALADLGLAVLGWGGSRGQPQRGRDRRSGRAFQGQDDHGQE
jgi:hypothetical protein